MQVSVYCLLVSWDYVLKLHTLLTRTSLLFCLLLVWYTLILERRSHSILCFIWNLERRGIWRWLTQQQWVILRICIEVYGRCREGKRSFGNIIMWWRYCNEGRSVFFGSGREQEELLANRELFFSTNGDLKCLRGRARRSIFVSFCLRADRYTDYTVYTMCQTLSYCKMKKIFKVVH